MEELTKALETKRQLSMAYHLQTDGQTDGQTERINQEIVVATTCHSRTNDLTMSKALQWAIK